LVNKYNNMKLRTKLGLITLFLGFIFFSNINFTLAVEPLKLQVPIPGGKSEISFNATTKPIGEYIQWLYSYAISIVGIVATIMLMFGGFTWLTAGGSGEKVGKARDIIFGSLTGLVLALTSYTILTLINPDLVNFNIQKINSTDSKASGGSKKTDEDANIPVCCLYDRNGSGNYLECISTTLFGCKNLKETHSDAVYNKTLTKCGGVSLKRTCTSD